jgi:hypothetical protein
MLDNAYVYGHLSPNGGSGQSEDRGGRAHHARRRAQCRDSGEGGVSRNAGAVQFTPKTVETKDERDKLMFRVRVRIDPERLRARGEYVKSGLPGIAYVKFWPAIYYAAHLICCSWRSHFASRKRPYSISTAPARALTRSQT